MNCFKPMDTNKTPVKIPEDLIKSMKGALDPWQEVQDLVSKATDEKRLSEKNAKKALMFSAHWLAGNFKSQKEKIQELEASVQDLQDKMETLKITASNASAISMGHQKLVQENSEIAKQNADLAAKLRDAHAAIRYLSASFMQPKIDHSKYVNEIQSLKAQLGQRDAVMTALNIPKADVAETMAVNKEDLNPNENSKHVSLSQISTVPMMSGNRTKINGALTSTYPSGSTMESVPNGLGGNVMPTMASVTLQINLGDKINEAGRTSTENNQKDLSLEDGPSIRNGSGFSVAPAAGTKLNALGQPSTKAALPSNDMSAWCRDHVSTSVNDGAGAPIAPVTHHINAGDMYKETGKTSTAEGYTINSIPPVTLYINTGAMEAGQPSSRLAAPANKPEPVRKENNVPRATSFKTETTNKNSETPLSITDMAALSKELGTIKVGDDPAETLLRIKTFQKVHSDLKDHEIFDVIVFSLDQDLKSSIPGSTYKARMLESLINEITELLGWSEGSAQSAFLNCTQRKGETIQAFADRLFTLYSFHRPTANTEDETFKNALIKQSHPDIKHLVGMLISPTNTSKEVMDYLKRADRVVKKQEGGKQGKAAVLEAVSPQGASTQGDHTTTKSTVNASMKNDDKPPSTLGKDSPQGDSTLGAEINTYLLDMEVDINKMKQLSDKIKPKP